MADRQRHPLSGDDWAERANADLGEEHARWMRLRAGLFAVVAGIALVWVLATRLF